MSPFFVRTARSILAFVRTYALYGPGDWHHAQQWHQSRMNNVSMDHINSFDHIDAEGHYDPAAEDHLAEHEFDDQTLRYHFNDFLHHDSTLGQHPHYTDIAAGRWANTFGAARGTRKAAWDLLGAPSQQADPDPHRESDQYRHAPGADLSGVNSENANHAYSLMHGIHNAQTPQSDELHRFVGHVNPREFMSKVGVGDEFHLPPTSFANVSQPDDTPKEQYEMDNGWDDREESGYNNLWKHFAGGNPHTSMVFKVAPGAKAIGGMNLGEEENGFDTHEMVTGGKFKVQGFSQDHNGTHVVHLQQTETHDPDQLIANKGSQGMKQANTNPPKQVDLFGSGLDKFFDTPSNPKTPTQPQNTNPKPYVRKKNAAGNVIPFPNQNNQGYNMNPAELEMHEQDEFPGVSKADRDVFFGRANPDHKGFQNDTLPPMSQQEFIDHKNKGRFPNV